MANPKHLALLKKGIEVWNEYWKLHPNFKQDLKDASLDSSQLERVNLSNTELMRAIITDANLKAGK